MFGLFQIFGRSRDLKALDDALQNAGLEPRAVPEAVKFISVRLLKQEKRSDVPLSDVTLDEAARLLGYCMLGHDQWEPWRPSGGAGCRASGRGDRGRLTSWD